MDWHKDDRHRLTVTSPWRPLDYWAMTRHFVPDEFRAAKAPGQRAEAVASVAAFP